MSEEAAGGATGLAVRAPSASPAAASRYLARLKPILTTATDARTIWVRAVSEFLRRNDLQNAHAEAVQVAIGQAHMFYEARRQLRTIQVPSGFEAMHEAIDAWLESLLASCETVVRARPPLTVDSFVRTREALREAADSADAFNEERASAIAALQDAQTPQAARPRIIASSKEIRAVVIVLVVLLFTSAGVVYAMTSLGATTPTVTPTPAAPAQPRRVFPAADVQQRLRTQIIDRQVAFQNAVVRLAPPNRVIVSGQVTGPRGMVPVEIELQMNVTDQGQPRLSAVGITAVGVTVPTEAFDALNKRLEEANRLLPQQLQPGEKLKRLFVENNAVVAEIDAGPAAPPKPPAKP